MHNHRGHHAPRCKKNPLPIQSLFLAILRMRRSVTGLGLSIPLSTCATCATCEVAFRRGLASVWGRRWGRHLMGFEEDRSANGIASSRIKGPVIGPNHTDVGCIKRRATASAHAFSSSLQHVACCQGRQTSRLIDPGNFHRCYRVRERNLSEGDDMASITRRSRVILGTYAQST